MMKLRTYLILGAATCLWAGCSSEESLSSLGDGTAYPIAPVVSFGDYATRGSGAVNNSSTFGASVLRIDEQPEGYPENYAGITPLAAQVTSGAMRFTEAQYFQITGDNTQLLAVYPATTHGTAWDAAAGTLTYPLDGATDIMVTNVGEGNKKTTDGKLSLQFAHLLSRVEFKVYGEDAEAVGVWKKVEGITLNEQPTSCVLTLPAPGSTTAPAVAFSTVDVADFAATDADGSTLSPLTISATTKATAQTFGYCLISPAKGVGALTLTAQDGKQVDVQITHNDWQAGYHYVVYLQLTNGKVRYDIDITPWDAASGYGEGDHSEDLV